MRLARALRILHADRRPTILLGSTHFLIAAAHGLFDIAATALLIAQLGPDALPQVYLGSALVLIFVGLVIIPLVDRLERASLFSAVLVVFGLVLLAQGPLASRAPDLVYRALYILCYLMKGLLFLQFWLLAGDLLDLRQAKRLFPLLLGCSLVGGLAASLTASILPRWVSTTALLTAAGFLLFAALVPVRLLMRSRGGRRRSAALAPKARLSTMWEGLRADVRVSWGSPLLRNLSLCLLLLALLAQVLDFLLGTAAHGALESDLDALTQFYAVLNGVVIGAGALVQFVFANRVVATLGVTRAQILAPLTFIAAFALTGGVFLAFGESLTSFVFLVTVVGSRAVQKVLRISLVRNSTDLIYNAIPTERRGRAKALKETMLEPMGVLLSGAFLMAGSRLPPQFVLATALVLSVVFLATAAQLKENYVESLVDVLKEKSRYRFAFPSVMMRQPRLRAAEDPSVSGLRRALKDDEASVRLLAVEVASELHEPEAAQLLVDRFRDEPDPEVRARMLSALGKMLHPGDDAGEGGSLSDRDPRVRAQGMESIAQSGILRREDFLLDEELDVEPEDESEDSSTRAPSPAAADLGARRVAFMELARSGEQRALEQLVHYLEHGDGATRHLAARALESCGEAAVDLLTLALWSSDVEGRRFVIRALDRIGTRRARQALLPVLMLEAEEAYYDLVRIDALSALGDARPVALLRDSLRQRVERARRNASHVLRAVFIGEPGMRLILSNLNHPDRFIRASAIEALEVRADPAMLGGILPLFEHESPRAIAEHGSTYFDLPSRAPLDVLTELTRHRAAWIRACAVFALGQVGGRDLLSVLEALTADEDELTRLNAVEAIGKLGNAESLPLLERLASSAKGKLRGYAETAIQAIGARASSAV